MLKHSASQPFGMAHEKKEMPYQHETMSVEWELTQTGVIVKCNAACLQSLGYSQNELIELSHTSAFLDLIHTDDRNKFRMAFQEAKAITSQETKSVNPSFNLLRIRHKKGSWRHIAYNTKISAQTKNLHFSGLDITYLLKDISFVLKEIRNFTQQLLAVTDVCQTKFEEKSCSEWMAIGDLVLKNLLDLLKTPINSYQLPSLSGSASIRPSSADKIDEEKKFAAEDMAAESKVALQETKREYQDSPDIHLELDIKGSYVHTVNESLEMVLGYSVEELKKIIANSSVGYLALLHESDRNVVVNNLKDLQIGISCFTVVRVKHHDSNRGYVCLGCYANANITLGTIHIVAKNLTPYLTDIRKLLHEARNAVQLIQAAFTEIKEILENKTKDIQIKQNEIAASAEQAKICIWNLLKILQRQTIVEFLTIKPVATNLTESINRNVNLFKIEAAKKGLTLNMSLPKDALYMFDRLQFEEILINLITNSLKYTMAGKITVALNITSGQNTSDDKIQLVVSDTGIGISREEMPHIFEGYYRTQKARTCNTGTGIGLPIVKQIVEKMGGNISVESKVNQGTTITLTFTAPKATDSSLKNQQLLEAFQVEFGTTSSPSNSQPSTPESASRQVDSIYQDEKKSSQDGLKDLKVLVVDDSEINTKIYEKMLVKLGCVCTRVLSGKLAIEAIVSNVKSTSSSFDVIFMDISMPDMDGLETTRHIKTAKLAEQSIVIGLSGNAEQDTEQKAFDAGMVDYLTKPATEKKLEAVIRKNLPALYKVKYDKPPHKLSSLKTSSLNLSSSPFGLFAINSVSSSSSSSSASKVISTSVLLRELVSTPATSMGLSSGTTLAMNSDSS